MRVMIAGSDTAKMNKIAVVTFLDGLNVQYKDNLFLLYKGYGYVSSIVEEWIDKNWGAKSARKCFNLQWVIEHWSSKVESVGYKVIEEAKPDLLMLFGFDECDLVRPAEFEEIPVFYMEKL